jgi:hypothetical protein
MMDFFVRETRAVVKGPMAIARSLNYSSQLGIILTWIV